MESGKIEFINATQMDRLSPTPARDLVKPESKPTLDEIAKLCRARTSSRSRLSAIPTTRARPNTISICQAAAPPIVVTALTGSYGIAADRLGSEGAGLTSRSPPTTQKKAGPRTAASSWCRSNRARRSGLSPRAPFVIGSAIGSAVLFQEDPLESLGREGLHGAGQDEYRAPRYAALAARSLGRAL